MSTNHGHRLVDASTRRPVPMADRRLVCAGLAALPLGGLRGALALAGIGGSTATAAADPADRDRDRGAAEALRAGGVAVLVRHARTDPGVGDPPGFDVAVCRTQRNLSEEGRAQSRRLGAWFRERGLVPAAVRSSRWCRCLDTASLAFGADRVAAWDALNSTFAERSADSAAQTAQLGRALGALQGRPGFEVWVTHMVNIQALAGVSVAMGEALVVRMADDAGARPRVMAQWRPGG